MRRCPHRLLILACSKSKRQNVELLPAIERYDGPTFRVLRKFLASTNTNPFDLYIVSAEFGLLPGSQKIAYYDRKMTPQRAKELQPQIATTLRNLVTSAKYEDIFVCAGKTYRAALSIEQPTVVSTLSKALSVTHGSLGYQLSMLHQWVYQDTSKHQIDANSLSYPTKEKVVLHGIEIAISREKIFELAHQAIVAGNATATRCQSWYVPVDDIHISPKWLVSTISGLPVKSFHSEEARRVLAQLGIEVKTRV